MTQSIRDLISAVCIDWILIIWYTYVIAKINYFDSIINHVLDNDNECTNKNPTNLPNWKEEKRLIMFSASWGAQWMTNIADFLIPGLRNIGILHYKKAKLCKNLQQSVRRYLISQFINRKAKFYFFHKRLKEVQSNLNLVKLLVSTKTVTKSNNVSKSNDFM